MTVLTREASYAIYLFVDELAMCAYPQIVFFFFPKIQNQIYIYIYILEKPENTLNTPRLEPSS